MCLIYDQHVTAVLEIPFWPKKRLEASLRDRLHPLGDYLQLTDIDRRGIKRRMAHGGEFWNEACWRSEARDFISIGM